METAEKILMTKQLSRRTPMTVQSQLVLSFLLLLSLRRDAVAVEFRSSTTNSYNLRIMTFNWWQGGGNVENGPSKIAQHILDVSPDIVAVQECYVFDFEVVLRLLGSQWSGVRRSSATFPDNAIITKHIVNRTSVTQTDYALGCEIILRDEKLSGHQQTGAGRRRIFPNQRNEQFRYSVDSRRVNVWSVHADYQNYGPYAACNKMVRKEYQIEAGEYSIGASGTASRGRVQNVLELARNYHFISNLHHSDEKPLIVAGDFNAPSHLDWTESAKFLHCDWTFKWPVSKLMEDFGFQDAYRAVYPDPVRYPGNTWSPVVKHQEGWGWTIPEPQDRIDYIYYKSLSPVSIKTVSIQTFDGNPQTSLVLPRPYHMNNTWPSDHYAVYGDFTISVGHQRFVDEK